MSLTFFSLPLYRSDSINLLLIMIIIFTYKYEKKRFSPHQQKDASQPVWWWWWEKSSQTTELYWNEPNKKTYQATNVFFSQHTIESRFFIHSFIRSYGFNIIKCIQRISTIAFLEINKLHYESQSFFFHPQC